METSFLFHLKLRRNQIHSSKSLNYEEEATLKP